ncbi:MAG: substrate-binding domain-containing protein [Chloroflexia bacterium]|nr:substrate-binding domain-containing protein [Chloroflexia bacterium]
MRRRNLILFVIFLLAAVGVIAGVYLGLLRREGGNGVNPQAELRIQVVYATEEGEWMRSAAERFNQEEHELNGQRIVVELIGLDSGEALFQIKNGDIQPTAWSPASMLWVNALNAEWRTVHGTDLIMRVGQYQATPLVLSPMVFVMWEDRAQVFIPALGEPDWDTVQQAVANEHGWQGLGGAADWGYVKFGQTDPVYSNSGLTAVTLATYNYHNKTRNLKVDDIVDPGYQNWILPLWRSVVGGYDRSSADLMNHMILYGPSTYDIIMVYENLVAAQMQNAPGRWGNTLRVFYPELNLWNDHPFCVLLADWTSADQKDAALEFQRYLLNQEIQEEALRYGFRPANVDVPVINTDPDNPFNQHQEQGLQVQIPRINLVQVPSADVIHELQVMFNRQR